jgi:RNA recognition motif-containing protein
MEAMNIYVGNLPYSVRDEELRATFEPYGTVVSAEVIFDKRTRRSRGYGFVEMAQGAEARRAIEALNGTELHGRELRVDASQPKSEKPTGERPLQPSRAAHAPVAEVGSAVPAEGSGIRGFFKRLFG